MDESNKSAEEKHPTCSKCGCDIIWATPDMQPLTIIVRTPWGTEHHGGYFCGGCEVALALVGVVLQPLPPEIAERRQAGLQAQAKNDEG